MRHLLSQEASRLAMNARTVSLLVIYLSFRASAEDMYKVDNPIPCNLRYRGQGSVPASVYACLRADGCKLPSSQQATSCYDQEPPSFTCTRLFDRNGTYYAIGLAKCSNTYISRTGSFELVFPDQLRNAMKNIVWTPQMCLDFHSFASVTTAYLTLFYRDDNRDTNYLRIGNDGKLNFEKAKSADCYTSGNYVSLDPSSLPKLDPCIEEIRNTIHTSMSYQTISKRQTSEALGRPLRLVIKAGGNHYLVTRNRQGNGAFANNLSITTFCQECLSADSLFYYKGYGITGIDPQTSLPDSDEGFTLLHTLSMQYLTTDVDNNFNLNADGRTKSGLIFQNADNFGEDFLSDYRHFLVYRRQDQNQNFVLYICPVHHRGHCMLPAAHGILTLGPLNGTQTGSQPSFRDPSDANLATFSDTARASFGGSTSPTFGIFERSPVIPVGTADVVFIAIYVGYADGSDTNPNGPLPFGSYYRVLSYNASMDALVFTTRAKAFQSPFRIMRQKWSDPGSTAEYVSFQLTSSTAASVTDDSGRYITRFSVVPTRYHSSGTASFGSVDSDPRLFNAMCCLCSQNQRDVSWIYYNGPGTTIVSLSASSNLTLSFRESSRSSNPDCQANAFVIRGA